MKEGKFTLDFRAWLEDRKNRRVIPHRMAKCGYLPCRNQGASDGLWKIQGRRRAVYVQDKLTPRQQLQAVRELVDDA